MSKTLKVHLFADCPGHYYSSEKDKRFTIDVRQITCGQCKGRILDVLRARDWVDLDPRELRVIENAALIASQSQPKE